jgi:hypothetical protein
LVFGSPVLLLSATFWRIVSFDGMKGSYAMQIAFVDAALTGDTWNVTTCQRSQKWNNI